MIQQQPPTQSEINIMAKLRFTAHGDPLPANLYNDNNGNPDVFRYKRPDGSYHRINDGYAIATEIAERANQLRESNHISQNSPGSFTYWLDLYLRWANQQNPVRATKPAWRSRIYELKKFASTFSHIKPARLNLRDLQPWWDDLSYDQQHNRRSAHSQFFQWLIANEVVCSNPFSTADNAPRLFEKPKPQRTRQRLTLDDFWAIYSAAGELNLPHIQIVMGISLATEMRVGDVLDLRWQQHIVNGRLIKTINKSEGQRGEQAATHLGWPLKDHPQLKKLIDKARQLAFKHRSCPFIVSYQPKQEHRPSAKEHRFQLLQRKLISDFTKARNNTARFITLDKAQRPTIREVRALAILLATKQYGITAAQQTAAHTNQRVTQTYRAKHEPEYQNSQVIMTENMIKGGF